MVTPMNRKLRVLLFILFGLVVRSEAQDYAPPPAPSGQILAPAQLSQLLGPIALYPDPLIAEVLPGATQPGQIAVAYSYITSGGDPNQIDAQNWDSSVKALARYPDVLKMLNDNLAWTTQLGQTFLNQAPDVMNAIQSLRAQAQQLGNLPDSPQESIASDDGDIEILPAYPDMLYVPAYDPAEVFYVPSYGRSFFTFGVGFRIGGWLNHDFDWQRRSLVYWGADHPRPSNWWRETPVQRRGVIGSAPVWRPAAQRPARPVVADHGDRGYVNRDVHVAAPRVVRPAPQAAPRTVAVHAMPARPVVSAFTGSQSARDTRAASIRGSVSRAPAAPPAARAPAPPAARPSAGDAGRKR